MIHPTAVVEPGAEIAEDAIVGPMCYVGPHVRIGSRTRLISHVSVLGRTTIGRENTIWPQVTLGAAPQDLKYHGENTELQIGHRNDLHECGTYHIGTENGGGVTAVGNDNLLMAYVHVGHDCIVGNHCVIANVVQMAGHIHVRDHAVISGATAIHHYATVAEYAFIGGMSRIVHDVPPFMTVEGHPAAVRGVNTTGLIRHRFSQDTIERIKGAYRALFRNHAGTEQGPRNMAESLDEVERRYAGDGHVEMLIDHLRKASNGLHGRYREVQRRDDRRKAPVK